MNTELHASPLGKEASYLKTYTPSLLFPILRKQNREQIGISADLPFFGVDVWRAFEISWLNLKGKPECAWGEFVFPCTSHSIVESKSFKLYLNSFNGSAFGSMAEVSRLIQSDLSRALGCEVGVKLQFVHDVNAAQIDEPQGVCLDSLDVECQTYTPEASLLRVVDGPAEERLYSHLLKSNCPVTGQPDWASVEVAYRGQQIDQASLLQYIVSFRDHDEFHEQCVERMFVDIMAKCAPQRLAVHARYTRRGGLDINPFRSTHDVSPLNLRLFRQ